MGARSWRCSRASRKARPPSPRPSTSAAPTCTEQPGGALRASGTRASGSSGSRPPPSATGTGFDFGSYGRVGIGSDLRGHAGYPVNVVSFGSRLEEQTYLELNFYYGGIIGSDP